MLGVPCQGAGGNAWFFWYVLEWFQFSLPGRILGKYRMGDLIHHQLQLVHAMRVAHIRGLGASFLLRSWGKPGPLFCLWSQTESTYLQVFPNLQNYRYHELDSWSLTLSIDSFASGWILQPQWPMEAPLTIMNLVRTTACKNTHHH